MAGTHIANQSGTPEADQGLTVDIEEILSAMGGQHHCSAPETLTPVRTRVAQQSTPDDFFDSLGSACPSHFGAAAIPKFFPNIIAVGTVYNCISAGRGPRYRKVGKKLIFERDSFIAWMLGRSENKNTVGV